MSPQRKIATMRVFVTGATGFIGTAIVQELLAAGHQVLGLARSSAAAATLLKAGAEVHRGDLEDIQSLQQGAECAEGVIHTGFIHDYTRFKEVALIDKQAIEAIGAALAGSDRPFIITSGTAHISPGRIATEDMLPAPGASPRLSEAAMNEVAAKGIRISAIRLSVSVHGEGDRHGLIPFLINLARQKGISAYIGEGLNQWNAVHRLDASQLFRRALENGSIGTRYHGVAESAIPFKDIAAAIGRKLNVPVMSIPVENAPAHFGMLTGFAAADCPTSSELTQQRLDWKPTHPTLLADLEQGFYFNH